MAGTLRDDLASLKIDRRPGASPEKAERAPRGDRERKPPRSGGGIGFGFLAFLLWMIPISLLGFAGFYGYQKYEEVRSKPEVTVGLVQTMTSGEAEKLLSAKGYLKSRYQALIGAKVPGRVEKMYVQEGSKVKKGDVLAVLEHNDMKANLASRQATLRRTIAELEEAKAECKQREREARRADRLTGKSMITTEEAEKATAVEVMAKSRVQALEASIELEKANVQETEANIRNMSLFAPFDGTVVEKQGEEGEVITPSAMSNSISRSAVVTLASLEKMEVETDVAENLLSRVAIGQPAEVSVSAVPNKHYRGRLRQIIPMGDRTRGTVKVKVEILDPDEQLFPELVATVHFLPDKSVNNPNAGRAFLFVPKAALFEENGHDYAWVVDAKMRVTKRPVEAATTNDALARVESGLSPGESVVLNPPNTLRQNETVKVAD